MKLAIVYHVYKNSSSLKASLENIFNQTDQNFELILINDAASSTVTKILKEFNFSKLQKFTYFKYSQNLGHAVSFNQAITHTDSDYVIFVGSNFVPNKNFVKLVNNTLKKSPNTDVISFNAVKNDNSCQIFDKINNKMKLMLDKSMKDKIFSVNLLRKQKILLNEQSYAPLTFIYQVLISFRKWVIVDSHHADYERYKVYTYNFYDIFEQNDNLISTYSSSKFWHSHTDLIEYLMFSYIISIFLFRIFHTYSQKTIKQNALRKVKSWLDSNLPNWRTNTILNNPKNREPEISKVFTQLKFKTNYINRIIRKYKL